MKKIMMKCPRCGAELEKVKGKDYYGCPNWLPNNKGCEGIIYWPEGSRKKHYPIIMFSVKIESKSTPGMMYQVKFYESGDIYCGCVSSSMGRFCRHKREAIEKVEKYIKEIKDKYFHKLKVNEK